MSGYLVGLECSRCAAYYPGDTARPLCDCGGPLLARYDLAAIRKAVTPDDIGRRAPTMWRYRELLPVRDDASIVSMGEGFTPMIPVPKAAREVGVGELWVKDEGMNPTGTFKARGASAAVSRWKELGVTRFAQPTVGSGGHAWAAYGARAGCEVHTALPVDTPELGWKGSLANGARVYRIDGTVGDVFRIMTAAAKRCRWPAGRPRALPRRGQEDDGPPRWWAALAGTCPTPSCIPPAAASASSGCGRSSTSWRSSAGSGRRPRLVSVRFRAARWSRRSTRGLDECLGAKHVETIARASWW